MYFNIFLTEKSMFFENWLSKIIFKALSWKSLQKVNIMEKLPVMPQDRHAEVTNQAFSQYYRIDFILKY